MKVWLAASQGYWGRGATVAEAMAALRKVAGRRRIDPKMVEFAEAEAEKLEDVWVDQLGYIRVGDWTVPIPVAE